MQNTIQKFRQSSVVFEKPGILSEKLKTLASSNYPRVQHFLLKLRTRFLLTNFSKGCVGFFLFYLDLELFAKIKKDLVSTHSLFTLSLRSKQNLKNPTHTFVDITKQKTCAKFQQKILNSMVVNFSDKKPGFLEIREVFLKLGIGFCISWLVL